MMSSLTLAPRGFATKHPPRRSPLVYVLLFSVAALSGSAVGVTMYLLRRTTPVAAEPAQDTEIVPEPAGAVQAREAIPTPPVKLPWARSTEAPSPAAGIPPEPPGMRSTEAMTAEVLGELRRSGPPQGAWPSRVQGTFQAWKSSSTLAGKVDFSDFQCFQRGCTLVATYPDRDAFDQVNEDIREAKPFEKLNYPAFRSGPMETQSGQIRAVWVLYSQEEP
jgi:hypothetical protein